MLPPRGDGRFNCDWFRAGDGKTGGAIVAVGTTTVGYLHQGTNWIICQQKGGDVRSAEGYRNHWFALDAGRQRPLGLGQRGRRPAAATTTASSAAACRTATARTARHRPTTGCGAHHRHRHRRTGADADPTRARPPVDADQDGVPATTDCDDLNRADLPGRARGRRRRPRPGLQRRRRRRPRERARRLPRRQRPPWTKFKSLRVTEAPAGAQRARVRATGKRKGCPKSRTFTTSAKGSVSLTKMFRKRLRVGAVDLRRRERPRTPSARSAGSRSVSDAVRGSRRSACRRAPLEPVEAAETTKGPAESGALRVRSRVER